MNRPNWVPLITEYTTAIDGWFLNVFIHRPNGRWAWDAVLTHGDGTATTWSKSSQFEDAEQAKADALAFVQDKQKAGQQ